MNLDDGVEKKFKELFTEQPLIVRSPGRVNLIGEHTDYNMGFVLPGAIDKAIYFAIAPRTDNRVHLYAVDLEDRFEFAIDDVKKSKKNWPNYLMGVVDQFNKAHHKINGFNCVFGGNIPIGAGLSSSAAVEAGLAFALNHIFELKIDKLSLVQLAQKSENEFVGVKCGIMDQYINIFGKQDNVLKIDCHSLEYEYVPFHFENISIVLFNTNVSHSLASSAYNQRRIECGEGVAVIQRDHQHVHSLRDVSFELLSQSKSKLDATVFQRCKFAVEENDRLLKACEALNNDDVETFGQYMYQTHHGLSCEYEVSCEELDYLVKLVEGKPNVFGARMMGGGFGGCTINLVSKNGVEQLSETVLREYEKKFNRKATMYITSIAGGTSIVKESDYAAI